MEDEKKTSAATDENQNEVVEIVQQEAELPENNNQEPTIEEQGSIEPAEENLESETSQISKEEEPVEKEVAPSEGGVPEKTVESKTDSASETNEGDEISNEDSDDQDNHDEEDHEENEFDSVELDGASKKELLTWLKKIRSEENLRIIDHLFKDLGSHFEILFEEEKKEALEEFLAIEGNDESDFDFKGDDVDKEFNALYEEQRHKRSHFFHQLEKQKEENLKQKTQLLDMIREIVDGEDQTSFNKVKKLQEEWKKVGQVPGAQNKTLWANYHALMDRFYDQRTIYFELKDLDRKKNLEAKLELCQKAEALDPKNDLKSAIVQLNELHEEFKYIGPVPKEDQEPLWERFKAASDEVYEHRKEYTEKQKEEHKENLEKKSVLASKAEEFTVFNSDRIKDWNKKTKELLALQKEWESIGGVPRDKARSINKRFWGSFKQFFANKNKFFKGLDAQKGDNLIKKQELVAKAKELKDSTDWEKTAKEFKMLQEEWRNIGHVPEKYSKSVYNEFKGYCDYFFDQRRGQNTEQNKEFIENLEKKRSILEEMENLLSFDTIDVDKAYQLADDFSEAGLVPRNAVGKTLTRYEQITKKILSSNHVDKEEVSDLRIHFDVCKLRNSPHGNQKVTRKENALKRKISGLENDINNWKTNIDFFGKSANAEQLKQEFQVKIDEAEKNLEEMKQELRHMH